MKPLPMDQRFYLRDVDHLAAEIERLGLDLPLPDNTGGALIKPLSLSNI